MGAVVGRPGLVRGSRPDNVWLFQVSEGLLGLQARETVTTLLSEADLSPKSEIYLTILGLLSETENLVFGQESTSDNSPFGGLLSEFVFSLRLQCQQSVSADSLPNSNCMSA